MNKLTLSLLAVLIACLALAKQPTPTPGKKKKPSIIFILADDLGYADLGCFGQQSIRTPNIDRLAREGVRFTNVYAGSTVCAPSRSTLMTGLHTGHTTVRGNTSPKARAQDNPEGRVSLAAFDTTLAQVLKKAGYVTAMTGKWGLGEPGTVGAPNRKGFDEWFGYLNQQHAHSHYPDYLWRNETRHPIRENEGGKKNVYSHDLFTQFALDFIQQSKDTTFFLYLPYTLSHAKYEVPDTKGYNEQSWTQDEIIYASMVSRLDGDVGRIIKLLQDLRIDEETVVFFCSDNGAAERWDGRFNSSGKFRGRKRDMYEGGIRTPMIVRQKGTIHPRVDSASVWYFADVMPTLASIAKVAPPKHIDGINVWPSLKANKPLAADRFLYWEFYEKNFQQAVRFKNWKAVRNSVTAPWELYDLTTDKAEQRNLATAHPEIIGQIEAWIKQNRTESNYWSSGLTARE